MRWQAQLRLAKAHRGGRPRTRRAAVASARCVPDWRQRLSRHRSTRANGTRCGAGGARGGAAPGRRVAPGGTSASAKPLRVATSSPLALCFGGSTATGRQRVVLELETSCGRSAQDSIESRDLILQVGRSAQVDMYGFESG